MKAETLQFVIQAIEALKQTKRKFEKGNTYADQFVEEARSIMAECLDNTSAMR